jgi:hypothetical protein
MNGPVHLLSIYPGRAWPLRTLIWQTFEEATAGPGGVSQAD